MFVLLAEVHLSTDDAFRRDSRYGSGLIWIVDVINCSEKKRSNDDLLTSSGRYQSAAVNMCKCYRASSVELPLR